MTNLIHPLLFGILFTLSNSVLALEVIEILGGKASEIPVAIVPFEDTVNTSGQKAHQIISSDLNRTGLFRPLNISIKLQVIFIFPVLRFSDSTFPTTIN